MKPAKPLNPPQQAERDVLKNEVFRELDRQHGGLKRLVPDHYAYLREVYTAVIEQPNRFRPTPHTLGELYAHATKAGVDADLDANYALAREKIRSGDLCNVAVSLQTMFKGALNRRVPVLIVSASLGGIDGKFKPVSIVGDEFNIFDHVEAKNGANIAVSYAEDPAEDTAEAVPAASPSEPAPEQKAYATSSGVFEICV